MIRIAAVGDLHAGSDTADALREQLGEVSQKADVLLLARIPGMGPARRNEAKRFVTLIDALYEHKVKLEL